MGCSIGKCKQEDNRQFVDPQQFACEEAQRVNWRRAEIVSFVLLFLTSLITLHVQASLAVFLLSWMVFYFYLNFDQYHRAHVACYYDTVNIASSKHPH
ncbi:MAG: hypothetical protein FJ308_23580 [Planctomycetes bacterium]|nr:hypothetical protein [Planctomycetota bacterium]